MAKKKGNKAQAVVDKMYIILVFSMFLGLINDVFVFDLSEVKQIISQLSLQTKAMGMVRWCMNSLYICSYRINHPFSTKLNIRLDDNLSRTKGLKCSVDALHCLMWHIFRTSPLDYVQQDNCDTNNALFQKKRNA